MSSDPFSRFPRAEISRWRELADAALAGADFDRSLRGSDSAGLATEPVYHDGLPGVAPVGDAARHLLTHPWRILQDLGAPDGGETRRVLEEAVEQGADAIDLSPLWLPVPWKSGQPDWRDGDGLAALVGSLPLERLDLWLECQDALLPCAGMLYHALEQTGLEAGSLCVTLFADPFSALPLRGSVRGGLERQWAQAAAVLEWSRTRAPGWNLFGADGQPWHEAGLGAAEELALVLSGIQAQLCGMSDAGAAPEAVLARTRVSLACDHEFFVTLAKFRAYRLLLDQLLEGWGQPESARRLPLRARTSWREMALADPWSNQLRLTGQLSAAACAGADVLTCGTWLDGVGHWQQGQPALPARDRRLARRLARTTPLLLRHEAFLERVSDPGGGAWFIEHQTRALAEVAWQRFLELEEAGGLPQAWLAGVPAGWQARALAARHEALARGRRVLVGVNRYVNLLAPLLPEGPVMQLATTDESAAGECSSLAEAFERAASEDWHTLLPTLAGAPETMGRPLEYSRTAHPFEALRRRAAAIAEPLLTLVRSGSPAALRARVDFVTQFLAAGGIRVVEKDAGDGDNTLNALLSARPATLLLCAADGDYPALLQRILPLRQALAPATQLVLAGHPKALSPVLGELANTPGLEYIHLGGEQLDRLAILLDGLEGGNRA